MANSAGWEWLTNLQFVTVETFVMQFVILLVVLWVLNKFIFRPYLAYLDEWEAKQAKVQEDYNNADAILEEKRKEGEKMLSEARSKGNAVIEESEAIAEKQIEQERNSMLSWAKEHILNTALKLNEKMFKEEKASKDFMKKHIDSL